MLVGQHILIECRGQHATMDSLALKDLMTKAAVEAGATVLFDHFHLFGGHGGITGVLLLAESHITVHTWPEHNYAAFDVFMCGNASPLKAADIIANHFPDSDVDIKTLDRGYSPSPNFNASLTQSVSSNV